MESCRLPLPVIALSLIALFGGCGTPKPVLKLANVTSANTSKLGSQLANFADREAEISKLRAENFAITVGQLSTLDYAKARRLEALRLANQTDLLALYTNLIASSEKLAALQESIPQKIDQQRTTLLSTQKQLSPPVTDLNAVAKSLATLGTDLNFKDWVTFYIQYSQDVDKALNQQLKELEDAKAKAATLSRSITNTIKGP